MERGFLSQKGSWVGRGVKEKDLNDVRNKAVQDGVVPSFTVAFDSTHEENVRRSSTGPTASESGPDVSFALAINVPGKSSYANVTSKLSGKKLNIRTLFTLGGNKIDVVVPMICLIMVHGLSGITPLILKKWHPNENLLKEDVSTIPVWVKFHGVHITAFGDVDLSSIATKLGNPLMLDYYTSDMCMQSWGRSSYARVMIEFQVDVELKDNIVVAMPRIKGEGYYTCLKNIGAGATKNLKKTSQTPKGISVVQKMGFKPKQRDSYPDNDDYDPYDDDMYENHDLSVHLQAICDDLDIMVRGRKKK
ncbi:zinc finger, CCHC-type containing protein [Tanacetum coccineum]